MKKVLFISLILLLTYSCNNKTEGFKIDVTIDDVPDGRKVFLKKQVEGKIVTLDTVLVQNNKFTFEGTIKEPVILGIFVDEVNRGAIFPFIDVNDHITITAYKDSLVKSKITGSILNTELTRLREAREKLTVETQKLLPEFQKATQTKDTATVNKINIQVKAISDEMASNDWDFIKNNPDSYISALVLTGLMSNPKYKDSLNIVFNKFSDKIKKAELSKPIRDYFDFLDKQIDKALENPKTDTSTKDVKIETH